LIAQKNRGLEISVLKYNMGHAVAQFVETLLYKPEDRGFES
jgi:hypothetical protein